MPGRNELEMMRAAADLEDFFSAAAIATAQEIIRLNNEGGPGAPPAPIDRGELRGSPRVGVNELPPKEGDSGPPYELTSHQDVARAVQLGGFAPGDVLWIFWPADHAKIIDDGRRLGSHGRMIGSEQAPDGWVYQAIETTVSKMSRWRYREGFGNA